MLPPGLPWPALPWPALACPGLTRPGRAGLNILECPAIPVIPAKLSYWSEVDSQTVELYRYSKSINSMLTYYKHRPAPSIHIKRLGRHPWYKEARKLQLRLTSRTWIIVQRANQVIITLL